MKGDSDRGSSWTLLQVLTWTAERFAKEGVDSPRLDAEVLLAHCLGVERLQLYLDYDKPLGQEERAAYRAMVQRRLAREPVAYITGLKEFWSLSLTVNGSVLIPRPETERLVELALDLVHELAPGVSTVVDVGTGSGAVAVALGSELFRGGGGDGAGRTLWATDADQAALEVARQNAERHGVALSLAAGDLLDALPAEVVPDLVLANLPYIKSAELDSLEPEVTKWEPRRALDGGEDGLDQVRRLVAQASGRLSHGGGLALEIGWTQGAEVSELMTGHGLAGVTVHQDHAGRDRVVIGRR
jgi:release factor glutamine methyltransferase